MATQPSSPDDAIRGEITSQGGELHVHAQTRAEVLAQVAVEVAHPRPELDPEVVAAALQAREEECSTELGQGLALPHAVLAGLQEPITLNVALNAPVRWGKSGAEVERCVVILVPPGRERTHLELSANAIRAHRKIGDGHRSPSSD